MPIGSTLDVLIQQDDLVVLGPPSAIDVLVNIGPPGQMGGQIYAGDFDPNTITPDQFRDLFGALPRPRDVFVRNDATEFYGSFYQYSEIPGGDQWQIIIDLVDVFAFYLSNNPITLGTDTTGDYVQSVSGSGDGISVSGTGEGASVTVSNTGVTSLFGTDSQVDVSDETGSVTISLSETINVDTSGNAATATTLETPRDIELSGAISGVAEFDGSESINIVASIEPDSVVLGTDTTGDYVADVTGTDGVSITGSGENASVVIANTDKGSSQNIFKTISSDQGFFIADSNGASVAILGGNSISTSASANIVTIHNDGVLSLLGTENEINISASVGNIILSLPDTIDVDISGNSLTVTNVPSRNVYEKTNDYTLVLSDAQGIIEFNSASAMILTIPQDSSVDFPIGSYIDIVQTGDAEVDIQADGAATVYSKNSNTKTSGQYSRVYLYKNQPNSWILTGDLSP